MSSLRRAPEPVKAGCGHLARPLLFYGEWVAPRWCDACAEAEAGDVMPLDEALEVLAKAIPPETMEKMMEAADRQRRGRPYRAWPGDN